MKKTKHINTRATEQTVSALEFLAKSENMNMSEYLAFLINREYNLKTKGE